MPPRKVKVVNMGTQETQEEEVATLPTSAIIEFDGDLEAQEAPPQVAEETPEPPTVKEFLDTEEIDRIIDENKKAKKSVEKAECIHCGRTMSAKSLKYSHSKTCKGLQPEDIQAIPEPEPEKAPEPEPEPEPIKMKKPRAKRVIFPKTPKEQDEEKVIEPIVIKTKARTKSVAKIPPPEVEYSSNDSLDVNVGGRSKERVTSAEMLEQHLKAQRDQRRQRRQVRISMLASQAF